MNAPEKVKGLREKRPGVWEWAVFVGRDAQGKTHHRTGTFHGGIRDAKKELLKQQAEVAEGNAALGSDWTVDQLLEKYIEHCVKIGRSPVTIQAYRGVAKNHLCPALGRIKLVDLTAYELDDLYARLVDRGLKPKTIHQVHIVIGAALAQAKKWGKVRRNVAPDATPPPGCSPEVTVPTAGEVWRVYELALRFNPGRAHLLLFTALTGARRGELCALRWTDVDWQDRSIDIARRTLAVSGNPGLVLPGTKTGRNRRIALGDLCLDLLRLQQALVDERAGAVGMTVSDDAYIFAEDPEGLKPLHPNALGQFARIVARKAGVDTHLHAFRHFSSSQGYAAGFDPVNVAAQHGHSVEMSLRTYAHVIPQRSRDLAASADRTFELRPSMPPMMALPPASETTTT